MINVYPHDNIYYFSSIEVYDTLCKAHDYYGRWLNTFILKNPTLKDGRDYIAVSFRTNRPGRKRNHILLTRQTAIAICIANRTAASVRLREQIEKVEASRVK